MAVFKIIFHKELNAIQCVYGYIGTSHECKEEIKGKIIFVQCSKTNCNVCKNEVDRKNTILWDGLQILMGILFVEHAMKNLGVNQSVKTFFVEFVMRQ